jgi:TusA-related sulfurtransferase
VIQISKNLKKLKKLDGNRYELDVRGLVCPFPQVLVTSTLENLSVNDVLEVLIDNPPSVRDIPFSLERKGYAVEELKLDKLTWKLTIFSGN